MSETANDHPGTQDAVDYFTFLGLPKHLALDDRQIQERYFALSRQFHPDFHAQADEETKQVNLERSSTLNRAYRTLRDPFERARYLLSIEWPDIPSEEKKAIPPQLLMDVMEMQEAVAELHAVSEPERRAPLEHSLSVIEERLRDSTESLRTELEQLASDWDRLPPDASGNARITLLGSLNRLLNTRSYLRTLLATIDAELRGGPGVQH
jgi:molecular chaperone HscB